MGLLVLIGDHEELEKALLAGIGERTRKGSFGIDRGRTRVYPRYLG